MSGKKNKMLDQLKVAFYSSQWRHSALRQTQKSQPMPGKRVQFDAETLQQVDLLGRDQMKDFQELADEAFIDLLKKHDRPVDLKDALRRSAGVSPTVHPLKARRRK